MVTTETTAAVVMMVVVMEQRTTVEGVTMVTTVVDVTSIDEEGETNVMDIDEEEDVTRVRRVQGWSHASSRRAVVQLVVVVRQVCVVHCHSSC